MRKLPILSAAAAALALFPVAAFAVDPFTTIQPLNTINYVVENAGTDSNAYGEIDMLPYSLLPNGAVEADGTTLPINPANQTLFNQIGTTYGGDGTTNFQLPDLNGRIPIGTGQGSGLTNRNLGDLVGADQNTLTPANLPTIYPGGQNLPVNNMQPSLALNYMIATAGVYPPRNSVAIPVNNTAQSSFTPNIGLAAGISPAVGQDSAQPFLSQVILTSAQTAPPGFLPCDGQILQIADNTALYSLLGTFYGGDGVNTFALPDLRGSAVVGVNGSESSGLGLSPKYIGNNFGTESTSLTKSNLPPPAGTDIPFNNLQPMTGLNYVIALQGIFPQSNVGTLGNSSPFLGQIAIMAADFDPQGWAECDGQPLSISGNTALFQLIGTTYGGDGVNTFDLPDLNGRTAADADDGTGLNGLTPFSLGEKTGVENVTLSPSQIPPVPEPAYFAPLALGAIALIARRRVSSIA